MYTVEDFAQLIFSYTLQKQKYYAAAEHALKKNLQSYLRPELFETGSGNVRLDNILVSIASRFAKDEDDENRRIFLEDVAGEFISREQADDLRAIVETKLEKRHGVSEEMADKFVSSSKILDEKEKEEFKKVKKDIVNLISSFISTFFLNRFKDWVGKKKKEEEIKKEVSLDIEVLPDSELMEQAEKEQSWQEGLVKDLFGYINKEVPENRQYAYKVILLKRFMAKDKMEFKEIAKKTGIEERTLQNWEKDLGRRLATFLSAAGLGPKFVEEGGLYIKDVKIPDYKDVLQNKNNQDDFKDFIKESISRMQTGGKSKSDELIKILDLFVDGKSTKEIIEMGFSRKIVEHIKSRYFMKWYKEWYEDMIKDIREASERIVQALMIIDAETPPLPSHEKAVEYSINKKFPLELTVSFGANYDLQDTIKKSERIDPEKDPVNFHYKHYSVKLDRTSKPRILYTYDQDLSNKGEFIGQPRSKLIIEGQPGNEELRKRLDTYVEKEMKPEGILPYGPSIKSRKPVHIPVEYINDSLDKTKTYDGVGKRIYRGFIDFADKYKGIMIKDQPHLIRVQQESKREEKRLIPKGGLNKIKKTIQYLKEDLEDEKGEKNPNKKRIDELNNQIKELQEHLKKDTSEEIENFISKYKERFKFSVTEERLKKVRELMKLQELVENQKQRLLSRKMKGISKDKETIKLEEEMNKNQERIDELKKVLEKTKEPFPEPESTKVKKLLTELSDLGIKDKKLTEYLSPSDLQFYANQIQGALAKDAQDSIEGIRKNKNMDEEEKKHENEAIERKRRIKLNSFIELFEAIPSDIKKRLEKYKASDPSGYKKLEEKYGARLNWADDPGDVLSKIKKNLSIPKVIEVPKGKHETITPMEESDAKSILNWLENQLRGFAVIGERFGNASLITKGVKPEDKTRIEKLLSEAEKEFQKLRNTIAEMEEKKESPAEIKELKDTLSVHARNISSLRESLSGSRDAPALIMANILISRLSDFSKMYNSLSKSLWFKPVTYEKRGDILIAEDEEEELATLQRNITKNVISFSKQSIFDKDSVKSLANTIRTGLKKFVKDFPKMASYDSINQNYPLMYFSLQEKEATDDWTKSRVRYVFPEGELEGARNLINQLKDKKLDQAYKNALKELKELTLSITSAYRDFDKEKINNLAKKENISFGDAGTRLKRIKDSMAKHALSQFILKWKDMIDKGYKKEPSEKGSLGGKSSEKFEKILEILEEDLPEIFSLAPSEEELKEPPRGVATPKEIRERIEEEFTTNKPKEMEEKFDFFVISGGAQGGGGGRAKGRPKPVKKHPPSYTHEILKSNFMNAIQTKSPHDIVLGAIGNYLANIRNHIKAGEYFDVDDIVAGIVDILYNFKKVIKSLKVSSAPTGSVDIRLKDKSDGVKLFNKLVDVYRLIDIIADPVKIGPLAGDLSKIKTQRGIPDTWFPKGLMDVYNSYTKEEVEKAIKKSASQFMAFKLAHKFSSLQK